jgi:hypothetical protein
MLQTISWMVKRETPASRTRTERDVLASFLAGGLVGGAVTGSLVALLARGIFNLGGRHETFFALTGGLLAFAYAGASARVWRLPMPQLKSQVPLAWRDIFRPRFASFLYSAGLGMFYFTRLGSAVALPMTVYALGLGDRPIAVVLAFGAAGLIRASTSLIVPLARLKDDETIRRFMSRFGPFVPRIDASVLMLVAIVSCIASIYG